MTDSRHKFSSAFNRVVRRHRLDRNLSQELLSEHAAVDRTYVGLLERGHRSAGLDVAKRLADGLGMPLSELVADAEKEWQQSHPISHQDMRQPAIVAEGKKSWQTAKRPNRLGSQPRRGRGKS